VSGPPDNALPEYLVKAAFLYNLASFIEWPQGTFEKPDTPLVLGIVGVDPFGDTIDRALADKKVRGHPLILRRVAWGPDLKRCHILFLASSESPRLGALASLVGTLPILTVGDDAGVGSSCIIAFVVEDNKVGFEINRDLAERARLAVSSKVLSLARVRRGGSGS
jgi:hypothetical protein